MTLSLLLDAQASKYIEKTRVNTNDFKLIKVIGRGAFGEVQLVCVHMSSNVCITIFCAPIIANIDQVTIYWAECRNFHVSGVPTLWDIC